MVAQSDACTVYRFTGADGEGIITGYRVFPGIELLYNDFRMGSCFTNKRAHPNIMEINHCRRGRFECEFDNGTCAYLEAGDLSVNLLSNRSKNPCFPLEHYDGVSVLIDIPEAADAISSALENICIDLYGLRERLCGDNCCFIMRATESVQHIFSELYTVPDAVKPGYFKLKVLELLLFLSIADISGSQQQRLYFPKEQVEVIKRIKRHITENMERHYTLEMLSARFCIPLTTMKLCFKGVYGTSIYAFIRSYRMQAAALMLAQSCDSVTEIANRVGYSNASKFACAFKQTIGLPPLKYRRKAQLGKAP